MNKKFLFAVVFAVLIIAGTVFVAATFEEQEVKDYPKEPVVCGPQTCNAQCGGGCGIPKCGCGG